MAGTSAIRAWASTIAFIWIVTAVVSDTFKMSGGRAFVVVAGAYLCLIVVIHLVGLASVEIRRNRRCAHGVRKGKDGGCSECIAEEERRNAEWQARRAIQEQKNAIKKEAAALHASEFNNLKKKWLSRPELYLQMSPRQFEEAIASLFRQLGYQVELTPYCNDRGKDAIAWKDGKKYLIECKRYDALNTIGRRDLQIFVAAMKEENADAGFYINTGRFANTVPDYASQNQIDLYDRDSFPALVNSAFPIRETASGVDVMCLECGAVVLLPVDAAPTTGSCPNNHAVINDITMARVANASFAPVPVMSGAPSLPDRSCDRCGSKMRVVNGWRGRFWGCSSYPKCKSTKPYRPERAT